MSGIEFQRRSVRQGQNVQQMAAEILQASGFMITDTTRRFPDLGVTVNLVAQDQSGEEWLFDVSGSYYKRPGLERTDTMWKTLGKASVLHCAKNERLVILTTNLPKPGSAGWRAMSSAATTFFDAIEMNSAEGKSRLKAYASASPRLPLPGLRSLDSMYSSLVRRTTPIGSSVGVGLAELSFPTPAVPRQYQVAIKAHRLMVIVPSQGADGTPIDPDTLERAGSSIIGTLCQHAGGTTGMRGVGAWVDPIGGVAHEAVSLIETYADEPWPESIVETVLCVLLDDLRQHAAAMILGDQFLEISRQ